MNPSRATCCAQLSEPWTVRLRSAGRTGRLRKREFARICSVPLPRVGSNRAPETHFHRGDRRLRTNRFTSQQQRERAPAGVRFDPMRTTVLEPARTATAPDAQRVARGRGATPTPRANGRAHRRPTSSIPSNPATSRLPPTLAMAVPRAILRARSGDPRRPCRQAGPGGRDRESRHCNGHVAVGTGPTSTLRAKPTLGNPPSRRCEVAPSGFGFRLRPGETV